LGSKLMAQGGQARTHVSMELGANAPFLVFDYADIRRRVGRD